MRRIFRDAALEAELRTRGYFVKRIMSKEAAGAALAAARSLRPEDSFDPQASASRPFDYHCTELDPNRAYKQAVARMGTDCFQETIESVFDDYRILSTAFFVKPPGKGALAVHRDWHCTLDTNQVAVSVWCPLMDVDEANSPLRVLPGSHGLVGNISGPGVVPYYSTYMDAVVDRSTTLCVEAGEAVFFDTSMLHSSPANSSSVARMALRAMCIPKEAQPVLFCAAPDASRLNVFEMDSAAYHVHDAAHLFTGQLDARCLGTIENTNRTVSAGQFFDLLRHGDQIRSGSMNWLDVLDEGSQPQGVLQRIGAWLGIKRQALAG